MIGRRAQDAEPTNSIHDTLFGAVRTVSVRQSLVDRSDALQAEDEAPD